MATPSQIITGGPLATAKHGPWYDWLFMPPAADAPDLLGQFLTNEDAQASDELLSRIVGEVAEPVVSKVVLARVSRPHAEDVRHDVLVELIARLRDWKETGEGSGIRDFRAYAAAAARNGCDDYYRRLFPQRYRLQKRLRYLLAKDRRFAFWELSNGERMCGRSEWRPPSELGAAAGSEATAASEITWSSSAQAADVVDGILGEAGAPIRFDDLVDRAAHHWGIDDHAEAGEEQLSDVGSIQATVQNRGWLKRLWREVGELPPRQRAALLLNLRDDNGGSALALFPITGVATIREIAAVLGLGAEELAQVWRELPWDDQRIAGILDLTRQQVANLRKAARERLSRRVR